MEKPKSTLWRSFTLILTLAAMFCAAWFLPLGANWLVVFIALVAFIILSSMYITGRPAGVLINERNLISLSRFQMVLWSIIILSAYFTAVIARVKSGTVEDPLAIGLDWRLWALMGISTTSLIGTPLILNGKKEKEPDPRVVTKAATSLKETTADVVSNKEGILYANSSMDDAAFTDMFQGDELQNTCRIDLSKVQMFLFTIVTMIAYVAILLSTFKANAADPSGIESLPTLSEGMIALLGISHAGYLASKGIDHTQTTDVRLNPV